MRNRKSILFVVEELSFNGAMKSLIALLKVLDPEKYSISLFIFLHRDCALNNQIPEYVNVLPEIHAYRTFRMPLKQALIENFKLGRIDLAIFRSLVAWQRFRLKSFSLWPFLSHIPGKYDIVCSYTDGFVAPLILKKVNALKTVCWVHYLYSEMPQPNYVYEALKLCNVCVPVSYEAGKALEKAINCHVAKYVVHNIVDVDEINELANKALDIPNKNDLIRIVSVGRVTNAKHFDIIPDVSIILKNKNIKFEWIIVGIGDKLEDIRSKSLKLGLEDNIFFTGELDNPMPLVKSADIIVNPSRHESWGMTVSEALCLGKAVIVSDIPTFAEQITDRVNGLICKSTPDTIANAIIELISNKRLRDRIEKNALNYPFTKQETIKEFDGLIKFLFAENRNYDIKQLAF